MQTKNLTPSETQLALALEQLEKNTVAAGDMIGLYLKVSETEQATRKQTITTIEEMFATLFANTSARIYQLLSGDMVIIFPDILRIPVEQIVFKIRFFVSDTAPQDFATFYTLKIQNNLFIQYVRERLGIPAKSRMPAEPEPIIPKAQQMAAAAAKNAADPFAPITLPSGEKMLTPRMLLKVYEAVKKANISQFLQQSPVCIILDKTPDLFFSELKVSLGKIDPQLTAGVNFMLTPWFYFYLKDILERQLLTSLIATKPDFAKRNFSLALSSKTVLLPEFLNFDEGIDAKDKSTIFIEFQGEDIFSDVASYMMAKGLAKSCGYKICIRGITYDSLHYINRREMEADTIKMSWNPKIATLAADASDKLHEDINRNDPAKIIVTDIPDAPAIEVCKALGLNLFTGPYISQLLSGAPATTATPTTPAAAPAPAAPAPTPAAPAAPTTTSAPAAPTAQAAPASTSSSFPVPPPPTP